MATKTETQHDAEFLVAEAPGTISRDAVTVTVPAETTLSAGTVLGKLSATGKYVIADETGSDGSEEAAGILFGELANGDDEAADMDAVVINFCAEVRETDLQWNEGRSDEDKAIALAALAALGIKAR